MARHPVDLLSFGTGLLVLVMGLLLLTGGLDGLRVEWAGPVVAIGLGAMIALAARRPRAAQIADPDSAEETSGPISRS